MKWVRLSKTKCVVLAGTSAVKSGVALVVELSLSERLVGKSSEETLTDLVCRIKKLLFSTMPSMYLRLRSLEIVLLTKP